MIIGIRTQKAMKHKQTKTTVSIDLCLGVTILGIVRGGGVSKHFNPKREIVIEFHVLCFKYPRINKTAKEAKFSLPSFSVPKFA